MICLNPLRNIRHHLLRPLIKTAWCVNNCIENGSQMIFSYGHKLLIQLINGQKMNQPAHTDNPPPQKPLSVGFILAPEFTLSAFSNFVDVLRLAADEGDFSRQIRCKWKILSHDSRPILSSSGLEVIPTAGLEDPQHFDYIVVVGGLLHAGKKISPQISAYLKQADEAGVTLIGVCTGSFILARAGLMHGYHSCVSWFHYHHFEQEFPKHPVSSDELFNIDGKRMTCAGGAGVMHLAAHLIEKHCGKSKRPRPCASCWKKCPCPRPHHSRMRSSPTRYTTAVCAKRCS
jgi:putative intracellular protease/amidase